MIPQHILDYWREQGKSPEEIERLCRNFSLDVSSRNFSKKYARYGVQDIRIPVYLELYKNDYTLQQIGDIYGCTRERVRQILAKSNEYQEARRIKTEKLKKRDQEIIELRKTGLTFPEIAKRCNITRVQAYAIAYRVLGRTEKIYPLTPIGCNKCETNEYARGLCKNCYNKWINRGKPDLPVVQEKKKSGPKPKPQSELMPIGCDECKTNSIAKGLCRRCYSRWHKRGRPELS